jgi:hypothetical protein
MDIKLHFRVLWRFKLILFVGLLLAITLAFLSYARVDMKNGFHVSYRQEQKFISYSQMLITQEGFPEGRSVLDGAGTAPGTAARRNAPGFADPSRFTTLALQYAKLVDTDPLRRIRQRWGPLYGQVIAAAIPATSDANGDVIPVLSIAGIATSPTTAERLSDQSVLAFEIWLRRQQDEANVPTSDRVLTQTISKASPAKIYAARSSALPLIVFIAVMVAFSALAFVLENLRPRIRAVSSDHVTAEQPATQTAA